MGDGTIRIGAVGFGGFAQFALEQFVRVAGVQLRGIAGSRREAAHKAAERLGIRPPEEVDTLVARDDIDLVYIATPPYLHHQQAMLALSAGKHVLCEKPLAMSLEQADEMIDAAQSRGLLLAVNQMQPYNPLAERIGQLVESRLLGEVLHAWFENYASDEGLAADHWFWDRDKSGGIFIEHGVHFFDLLARWLGEGRAVAAQRSIRPGTAAEEQVQCTVRYGPTAMASFYHGFHQAGAMDRQELRLVFERGDLTVCEWVPRYGRVHALVDAGQAETLAAMLPGAQVVGQRRLDRPGATGRGRRMSADRVVDMIFRASDDQQGLYAQCLRELMADQVAWICEHSHERRVTAQDGRRALSLAVQATQLAEEAELDRCGLPAEGTQRHKS